MTKGGTRPGAGRKPRPDDKMIRIAVSLTPEQYDWLKSRYEGISPTIRWLVFIGMRMEEEAKQREIDTGRLIP